MAEKKRGRGRPKGSKNKKKKFDFSFDSSKVKKASALLALPDKTEKKISAKDKKKAEKQISKYAKDASDIYALFGKDAKNIQKLIDSKDDDNMIISSQRALLKMLVDLIPIAEDNYREYRSERSAYALNALVSQSRELMQDIVSSQDRSRVADIIIYNILQPAILTLGQFVIENNHQTKKHMSEVVDVKDLRDMKDVLDKSAINLGGYLNTFYEDLKERIAKELGS